MKISFQIPKLPFACLLLTVFISCSKDSDLLADYVINDSDQLSEIAILLRNDFVSTSWDKSIIIDVLANDDFPTWENVKIVNVSNPASGEVLINENKTLIYTPPSVNDTNTTVEEAEPAKPIEDTFVYTTEVTNEDNSVTVEEATVTVTVSNTTYPTSGENVYFVSATGSSSNDGKTEQTAWNWSHAVLNARAGDFVYVKAGTYNNLSASFNRDGTTSEPIRFIGYKETPGDIDYTKQNLVGTDTKGRRGTTVLAGGEAFDYKNTPTSADMPYFTKSYVKNDPPAFLINGDFVEIENMIVNGYDVAFRLASSSEGAKIRNTIAREQGNMSISVAHNGDPDRYNGTGYEIREASNFDISFNTNLNSEQNAFQILGATNGTMTNNVAYSYNMTNGIDYMFLLSGSNGKPTTGLTIEYNLVDRNPNVPHGGHAFVAKNGANNNIIKNFHVNNSNIEVNFTNVYENLFENGTVKGSFYTNGDPYGTLFQTNGAHHNTFKNIIVDGTWGGISSHDYNDGASSDSNIDSVNGGVNNFFVNIIVTNSMYGVIYSESGQNSQGLVKDNNYINCTFYNVEYAIRANNPNSNNQFYNCTFTTSTEFITSNVGVPLNSNTVFENCHFGGVSTPNNVTSYTADGNIGGNPQFSDSSGIQIGFFNVSGLLPGTNSPLINAGKNVSNLTPHAAFDFMGKARNNNVNIGAL